MIRRFGGKGRGGICADIPRRLAQGGAHNAAQTSGLRGEDLAARAAELDHGLHGGEGRRERGGRFQLLYLC